MFRKATVAISLVLLSALTFAPAAQAALASPAGSVATVKKAKPKATKSAADLVKLNINVAVSGSKDFSAKVAADKKSVKVKKAVEAGVQFDTNQQFIGIDLPYHLYHQLGYPYSTFEKPFLDYSTSNLDSLTFKKKRNIVSKTDNWMVWGRTNGPSEKEKLEIKGTATAKKAGSGLTYGGSKGIDGIPSMFYTHRNTVLGITVTK